MTTLITRLYADKDTAKQASEALEAKGFDRNSVSLLGSDTAAMADAGLDEAVSGAYAAQMSGDNSLLMLRAPFGSVGTAVSALNRFDAIEVDTEQETYIRPVDDPSMSSSIIPGNKKFLTSQSEIGSGTGFSEAFGMRLLSRRQQGKAKVGHSTKTGKRENLLSRKQTGKAKVSHRTVTGKRWNLIKKPSAGTSVIHNPTPFSSMLGWPTIIRD